MGALIWTWLVRIVPIILGLIPVGMALQQKKELEDLRGQITGPISNAKQFIDGAIVQMVPQGTPGATNPTRTVTATEVAKDAFNNPSSLWALAAIIVVSPLLIRQIRGWGYDITDATKEVYSETKGHISGAREHVRHAYKATRQAHEYVKSDPRRRGQS
ncbi:hypothetical protein [Deinococcus roseus]|uniref:Uncharacterized protein n=1 Tax=Deinococcus roseus TaxID=392414 RepID=A0ABQ2DJ07_9DEIO|nr:hypothetical protein [Deinococcus roseus]GGJ56509.1 hypothetical protein GCM10008938_48340 [Deinococcus roseus]